MSSGDTAVQLIKTACGFAFWYSLCQAGGAGSLRWDHPWHSVAIEVQASWGLGPALCFSAPPSEAPRSHTLKAPGLTFLKKASLLWMSAPQYLWAWAIARTDQRLSGCYSRGPGQAFGSRVAPFHPQPYMQDLAIIFGVNSRAVSGGMELGLELLWVPSERSHQDEGTGPLDAGETLAEDISQLLPPDSLIYKHTHSLGACSTVRGGSPTGIRLV